MSAIKFLKTTGINVLKSLAVGIVAMLGSALGSMVTRLVGLPTPAMPAYINLATIMPLIFLTWMVIAILLGECFQRLYPRYWQRLLGVWLCNYLLYSALNTLDGLLFTPFPNMTTGFFSNLIGALFPALVIAWLWKPGQKTLPEHRDTGYFSARPASDWALRFIAAWLIYPPVYYGMGRLVEPFIIRYYQDPSLNLGLALPSLGTLLAMQVLRGAFFLLAVLPIIYAWRGTRLGLWAWVGSVIFVQIAATLVIQATWLPLGLRIPHTLELLADSFVQAGLYTWLLFTSASVTPVTAVKASSPLPAKP